MFLTARISAGSFSPSGPSFSYMLTEVNKSSMCCVTSKFLQHFPCSWRRARMRMMASSIAELSRFQSFVLTQGTKEKTLSTTALLVGAVRQAMTYSPNSLKGRFPPEFLCCKTPAQRDTASLGILPLKTDSSSHDICTIFLYCCSMSSSFLCLNAMGEL